MKKLTLAQAKQIDLVDYLALLGHYPDPKRSNSRDYWYLSPLPGRNEKTPSFKVDRKLNLWFDFGIGKGGSLSPATPAGEEKKLQVVSTGPITSPTLIHYLEQRKIPVELAQAYCREVRYGVRGKEYYAIGFASDTGGYELRNSYFTWH